MEEESNVYLDQSSPDPCCSCYCMCADNEKTSTSNVEVSDRKIFILTTVARTESYLREHRIPELLRVLITMILAHLPDKPVAFLEKLLDDCMLYRAGYGLPPVLFETRHLEAILRSFDPGQRGWLTAGQVQRIYTTLGFSYEEMYEDRIPIDLILTNLKKTQESELLNLLKAGSISCDKSGHQKFQFNHFN